MNTIRHKRGDSLSWACVWSENSGVPYNLTGCTIAAQIRTATGSLVATLTANITDTINGAFTLSATAEETADWAIGTYECDIQRTSSETKSSETFRVIIVPDITRNP